MKTRWHRNERNETDWERADLTMRTRNLPLRQRADLVFWGGFAFGLGLLFVAVVFLLFLGRRVGWLQPPLLQPMADERILNNVQRDAARVRLDDAVEHLGDTWLLHEGGDLSRYRPELQLWSSEKPFSDDQIRLTQIRSDALDGVAQPGLWGLTTGKGLARRDAKGWSMLFSNTAFLNFQGVPFASADLVSAALSSDQTWLLLATKADGVGLYHVPDRTWLPRKATCFQMGVAVKYVAWFGDRFYFGGDQGLFWLNPDDLSGDILDPSLELLDLDAAEGEGLWVLARKSLPSLNQVESTASDDASAATHAVPITPGQKGLYFARYPGPDRPPQILMEERALFPQLDLLDLNFACEMGKLLVLAGRKGMYTYDLESHGWQQPYAAPVRLAQRAQDQNALYFAGSDAVGVFQHGRAITWALPGEDVVQLNRLLSGAVVALTAAGALYRLAANTPPESLVSPGDHKEKVYNQAVARDDQILLLGPEGGTLHNVSTRSYRDIPKSAIPAWVQSPDAQLLLNGETLFAIRKTGSSAEFYSWSVKSNTFNLGGVSSPVLMPLPESRPVAWGDRGLFYIAKGGQVLGFEGTRRINLTGAAQGELASAQLLDAAAWEGDLALATDKGLAYYQSASREFSFNPSRPDSPNFVELASRRGALLKRTSSGRLFVQSDRKRPDMQLELIGGPYSFPFSQSQISDGMSRGDALFLAGAGKVVRYDMEHRRISKIWELPDKAAIKLVGIQGNQPLSLAGGNAYYGEDGLDPDAGTVTSFGQSGRYLYTMRTQNQTRYLKAYPADAPNDLDLARCSYHHPAPGVEVKAFISAIQLTNGTVVASTNAGLRFYSPGLHTWFRGPQTLLPRGGQLYYMDGYVFFVEALADGRERVAMMPDTLIKLPLTCADDTLTLKPLSFDVRSFTIQQARNEAAWLKEDGSVERWQRGHRDTILSAGGLAPNSAQLRCVAPGEGKDQLNFASSTDVWSYDCILREWQRSPLLYDGHPLEAETIELGSAPDGPMVSVRQRDGSMYVGELNNKGVQVQLTRVYGPQPPFFDSAPTLLDVQGRPNTIWTFVLADRIGFYDPRGRRWVGEQRLPANAREVSFSQGAGLDIITTRSGWMVAQDYQAVDSGIVIPVHFASYSPEPGDKTAIDSARQIWRLTPKGELQRGRSAKNGDYGKFITMAGPALTIDATAVRKAYSWGAIHVLETDRQLVLVHGDSDSILPLKLGASFGNVREARVIAKDLWLLNASGLLRLTQDSRDSVASQFIQGAERLCVDASGTPWARLRGSWRVWDGADFVEPYLNGSKSPWRGMGQPFVFEGAEVTGLSSEGVPHHWANGFVAASSELEQSLRHDIQAMFRGLENEWWLCVKDKLIYLDTTTCMRSNGPGTCLYETARQQLPAPFGDAEAWTLAGYDKERTLRMVVQDQQLEVGEAEHTEIKLRRVAAKNTSPLLADVWYKLRKCVVTAADGREMFNPITTLSTNQAGLLVAVRPFGEQVLSARGDVNLQKAEALDCTWLRWDRAKQSFVMKTQSGPRQLAPNQFIKNGRMLFEEADALTFNEDGLFTVNRYGIWGFPAENLAVDDPSVQVKLLDLGTDFRASHGIISATKGSFDVKGQRVTPTQHQVTYQDLVFTETPKGLKAVIAVDGRELNAFGTLGFVWDGQRQGIAFEDERLLLHNDVGFQSLSGRFAYEPGPDLDGAAGRTVTAADGSLYLQYKGQWQQRVRGQWQPSSSPFEVPFFDDGTWSWQAFDGALQVRSRGKAVPVINTPQGPAFASDLLVSAQFIKDRVAVVARDGLRVASDPTQLVRAEITPFRQDQGDRIESLANAAGLTELFLIQGQNVSRWDSDRFLSDSAGPALERIFLETPRLRFTMAQDGAKFELLQERLNGADHWESFQFNDGRFPFDRVSAIATRDTEVYVGTPLGLQVYKGSLNTSLRAMQRCFDLRARDGDPAATVLRMGVPSGEVDKLWVKSSGLGLEIDGKGAISVSAKANRLTTRVRVAEPLWRWLQEADGKLIGRYDDGSATWNSPPIELSAGRMPHDRLRDLAFVQGKTYALWENGWVTATPGPSLSLGSNTRCFDLTAFDPRAFVVVSAGSGLGPQLEGLHLQSLSGSFLQLGDQGWSAVTAKGDQIRLADLVRNPPVFQQGRLRLLQVAPLRFEFRGDDELWQLLPWQDGRLAIDQWRGLATNGQDLWAATPVGLLRMEEKDGAPYLNPEHLELLKVWSQSSLGGRITDFDFQGGTLRARIDQDSGRVFSASLDDLGRPFPPSKHNGGDPFAEQTYITAKDSGFWTWRVTGRAQGRSGSLLAQLGQESLRLLGGRFDFDALNSVALVEAGQLDFATDLGGWYRTQRDSFHPRDLKRVALLDQDPTLVERVAYGYDHRGPVLALKRSETSTLMVGKGGPQEVGSFREFLGQDQLWNYFHEASGLVIEGRKGVGQREMEQGRFTDDIVRGFPQTDASGTYVPTQAGVVRLGPQHQPEELMAPPFPGLGAAGTPAVLLRFKGRMLYAGEDAFYGLDGLRSAVTGLGVAAPDGYKLERIDALAEHGFQVTWRYGLRRGFTQLSLDILKTYEQNQYYLSLEKLEGFVSHRLAWGNPDPWIQLDFSSSQLRALSQGRETAVALPQDFQLVNLTRSGERLFLLGEHHLLELNLEQLATRIFEPP